MKLIPDFLSSKKKNKIDEMLEKEEMNNESENEDLEDVLSAEYIEDMLDIPEEYQRNIHAMAVENDDAESGWDIILYVNREYKTKAEYKSPVRQVKLKANKLFNINPIIQYKSLDELNKIVDGNINDKRNELVKKTRMEKMAKDLFALASKQKASDIHINVEDKIARVKIRVHGLLKEETQWDAVEAHQFISTVYTTMCDVSDSYFDETRPQNARISDRKYLPKEVFGIRVATANQTEGLYIVFRLLYQQNDMENLEIKSLGYVDSQVELIEKMKQKPTGINIIVGATGSGKSTTLQLVLSRIIKETLGQKNVITVEDPPEYPINGAIQIPVANAKKESERKDKFNQAITAAMRLDPDIIMLGEMRDEASSKLGLRAAMTGHQVWTTLHANSVFGALERLTDYDISLDMLADPMILTGIIYQTLVQVLCEDCKIHYNDIDLDDVENLMSKRAVERLMKIADMEGISRNEALSKIYFRGHGCSTCEGGPKGIVGRKVVAEILYPDEKILEMIRKNEKERARHYWLNVLGGRPVSYQAGVSCFSGDVDPVMAEDKVGFFEINLEKPE